MYKINVISEIINTNVEFGREMEHRKSLEQNQDKTYYDFDTMPNSRFEFSSSSRILLCEYTYFLVILSLFWYIHISVKCIAYLSISTFLWVSY